MKSAIAATTAALTLAVAGGATGVLPLPGGHTGGETVAQGAVQETLPVPATGISSPTSPSGAGAGASTAVSVESLSASSQAGGSVSTPKAAIPTAATAANLPVVPDVTLPTLPAGPVIPPCVTNLIPTGVTVPDPVALVAQLPGCILTVVTANLPIDLIQSVIGSANLPVDVIGCISSVLRSIPALVGGNLSGMPQLLSACVPTGAIPGVGSIPGMGSIPGLDSIPFMDWIPFMGSFPGFGTAN